ncbi:TonB-dependent receptor domain-containing protein [Brevundimonas sp. TSRC1-1]|uniref:TonB-dependent receptor domain-containing protein n=1 Tax=Brevundimonas sp. TSRC1-1 TaxID=2804562 RepID=UPI003CFB5976
MKSHCSSLKGLFLASTAAVLAAGLATTPAAAQAASGASAQGRAITIPAQPLGAAVQALSEQTDAVVIAAGVRLNGRRSAAVSGAGTVEQALTTLLRGTGLGWRRDVNGAYVIAPAADEPVRRRQTTAPAALSAPQQARPDVAALEDIVVTARRMEERIIDVPVAVSAFSAQQLDDRKVEGGAELLRIVPNVSFSKDNFTSYNFSIRGIGSKVLATTADPGVAVSFNNTALLRNRLFEQEYFDVDRVEVLRGPQGTLYGRNATAGVINMLPNLPELEQFSMDAQWEVGNHDSRRAKGMINIPVGDTLAVRGAFAVTQRDGFDYNTVTQKNVNGRDLWGARLGVLWQPTQNFSANFLWERFREDDDRSRTGKMLCTRGTAPDKIDWTAPDGTAMSTSAKSYWTSTTITPSCTSSSLYDDAAYGVPDGRGFAMTAGLVSIFPFETSPRRPGDTARQNSQNNTNQANGYDGSYLFPLYIDPFATEGDRQVADLRTVSTAYDPKYQADNDLFQLNLEWKLTPGLTLSSQTLYMEDGYSGFQDFFRSYATGQMYSKDQVGRYNGQARVLKPQWAPWIGNSVANGKPVYVVYKDSSGALQCGPLPDCGFPTGGTFLDPQLGATDRLMALDLSQADSTQWSQEFRLQSHGDGPFNFNLGANWLKYKTEENYWIFSNVFTLMAIYANEGAGKLGDFDQYGRLTEQGQAKAATAAAGDFDASGRLTAQGLAKVAAGKLTDPNAAVYIDPTPLAGLLNGEGGDGHNYIRSTSISRTESWAVFGEGYWKVREDLRLTLGLRYTDDTKTITPVPGQLLAATPDAVGDTSTGLVGRGYPRYPDERMNWGEWTGRAAVDWKPDLAFTDDTLVYASYSRGYKGGGGNPRDRDYNPALVNSSVLPSRYDAEFVNAYEAGVKNMVAGGRLMLNATAFYYDYKDYQVAQIIERAVHNENFDAKIWGAEFETAWAPTRHFRLDATLGLLRTRIADGEESIDVMDRLQGHDDWVVARPYPGSPSTCVVPKAILGRISYTNDGLAPNAQPNVLGSIAAMRSLCPSMYFGGTWVPGSGSRYNYANGHRDQWQAQYPISWNPLTDAPNGGRGFAADLSGNELPNAPHLTFNLGAQYRFELPQGWDVTVRGDYYRQSDSWMRVYNSRPYDRLKGWANANLSLTLSNRSSDFTVQAYVKNVFDDTPIVDGFTGPDDLGNSTNVFTLDPRIIGVSVRKSF